jgi:hypothetical protein
MDSKVLFDVLVGITERQREALKKGGDTITVWKYQTDLLEQLRQKYQLLTLSDVIGMLIHLESVKEQLDLREQELDFRAEQMGDIV